MEVRESALFGLSQEPGELSLPVLIEIAKSHPEQNIRKKAIFWLGQSNDTKAKQALLDIINAETN